MRTPPAISGIILQCCEEKHCKQFDKFLVELNTLYVSRFISQAPLAQFYLASPRVGNFCQNGEIKSDSIVPVSYASAYFEALNI